MRIMVVGAGSTGGYFGARLTLAGRDVTFLVRAGRAAQLSKEGLNITSPHGDARLSPQLVQAGAIERPYDVVILAVKAYALDSALEDMAAAVGAATMILPLTNGMRHVEAIRHRFGRDALIGCVCRVSTTLDAQGHIVQFGGTQELIYGEMNGTASPRMVALDALLSNAGFTATLTQTIEREMWEKWLILAALAATNCLMRGNVGEAARAPGGPESVHAIFDEVLSTISKAGVAPRSDYVANARALLSDRASQLTASLFRDLLAGNAVESDQILGDLVARAQAAGVQVPLLKAACAQLSVYSARRASGR